MNPTFETLDYAARAIGGADALLICSGAGMGVDSGLPDFRGDDGFWRAYPPFAERGLSFHEVANPQWFRDDPQLAWGFYGHRYNLYRDTPPHQGFAILKSWSDSKANGAFVFTSNVDGHFQKAGFSDAQVCEVHGSILYLQCSQPCGDAVWPAGDLDVTVDESTFEAEEPLPKCPNCGKVARPNILMFSDGQWIWNRTQEQQTRLETWLGDLEGAELAVVEVGAGKAIPTVRRLSEQMQRFGATLVRINPREADGPPGTVSLSSGALSALQSLNERI